eukprot:CAMPEP_0177200048 /NCGR_PEP_ID=MMETSP0367-20130122/26007_1 /TAXON_ID=447022 ORGANISM="Scrippsiella hangoei-like, Strain SHHI-4" /NCGR_SAMPLE_ID=MMETSP0367 /ASSEMBLY_ACC=CAM_ASM_000362 /LENGTH=51 /DNA_ID=CAMNT_0018648453 /DNA_START=15 /DNA_END=167 /DNA_ORIENTATION=+
MTDLGSVVRSSYYMQSHSSVPNLSCTSRASRKSIRFDTIRNVQGPQVSLKS